MDINTLLSQLSEWLGAVAMAMLAGTSPRFSHRPLAFVYSRREITFALSLYGAVLSLAFIFYQFVNASDPTAELALRLLLAAIAVGPFVLAIRLRGQPARSTGWNRPLTRAAVFLGIGIGLLAVFLRGKIFTILNGVSREEGIALILLLGISLAEETIFRGYILPRLGSALNPRLGWLVSAVLFALWMLPLRLAFPIPGQSLWLSLGLSFFQGLVLAFLAARSGHILAPAVYRAISEWLALIG